LLRHAVQVEARVDRLATARDALLELRVCDGAGVLAADGVAGDFRLFLVPGFAGFNGLIERAKPAHKASSSSLNWRRRLMVLAAVFASARPR
jgi:hypothetical protein